MAGLLTFLLQTLNDSAIETDRYQTLEWGPYTKEEPRRIDGGWTVYEKNPIIHDLSGSSYDGFHENKVNIFFDC